MTCDPSLAHVVGPFGLGLAPGTAGHVGASFLARPKLDISGDGRFRLGGDWSVRRTGASEAASLPSSQRSRVRHPGYLGDPGSVPLFDNRRLVLRDQLAAPRSTRWRAAALVPSLVARCAAVGRRSARRSFHSWERPADA